MSWWESENQKIINRLEERMANDPVERAPDILSAKYESPINESVLPTGLLNFLGMDTQVQPNIFGDDATGGQSPSYPMFRTHEDYARYRSGQPRVTDFVDQGGNVDEASFEKALNDYYLQYANRERYSAQAYR
jgi:hypothetical protein